jgi:hypothetical protein
VHAENVNVTIGGSPGLPTRSRTIPAGRSLTILHLSDVQFGKNHVFAVPA